MAIYLLMAVVLAVRPGRLVSRQGTRLMPAAMRGSHGMRRPARRVRSAFDQRMAAGLFALMALLPLLSPVLGGSYLLLDRRAGDDLRHRRPFAGVADRRRRPRLVRARGVPRRRCLRCRHRRQPRPRHPVRCACPPRLPPPPCSRSPTGAIAVRTRGVYFIMITLAFGTDGLLRRHLACALTAAMMASPGRRARWCSARAC